MEAEKGKPEDGSGLVVNICRNVQKDITMEVTDPKSVGHVTVVANEQRPIRLVLRQKTPHPHHTSNAATPETPHNVGGQDATADAPFGTTQEGDEPAADGTVDSGRNREHGHETSPKTLPSNIKEEVFVAETGKPSRNRAGKSHSDSIPGHIEAAKFFPATVNVTVPTDVAVNQEQKSLIASFADKRPVPQDIPAIIVTPERILYPGTPSTEEEYKVFHTPLGKMCHPQGVLIKDMTVNTQDIPPSGTMVPMDDTFPIQRAKNENEDTLPTSSEHLSEPFGSSVTVDKVKVESSEALKVDTPRYFSGPDKPFYKQPPSDRPASPTATETFQRKLTETLDKDNDKVSSADMIQYDSESVGSSSLADIVGCNESTPASSGSVHALAEHAQLPSLSSEKSMSSDIDSQENGSRVEAADIRKLTDQLANMARCKELDMAHSEVNACFRNLGVENKGEEKLSGDGIIENTDQENQNPSGNSPVLSPSDYSDAKGDVDAELLDSCSGQEEQSTGDIFRSVISRVIRLTETDVMKTLEHHTAYILLDMGHTLNDFSEVLSIVTWEYADSPFRFDLLDSETDLSRERNKLRVQFSDGAVDRKESNMYMEEMYGE